MLAVPLPFVVTPLITSKDLKTITKERVPSVIFIVIFVFIP